MSALGQKQTFAPKKAKSALPPKADMCRAERMSLRWRLLAPGGGLSGHRLPLVSN
jgi:hypothetical protein